MNKESMFLSVISLAIVLAAGFFVLKVVDETSHDVLARRVKLLESRIAIMEKNRFTSADHQNYLKQSSAVDQITQTRFVRIFDRLRTIEEDIREHHHQRDQKR